MLEFPLLAHSCSLDDLLQLNETGETVCITMEDISTVVVKFVLESYNLELSGIACTGVV